ncbi:YbaN family protein [Alteromonas sp. D210916BOD_24]|uniref:YbaN family protein n=1 Tax=Alteromonas sp. D210916BOD_24 TaxID=3157618 RepID=UPI00399CD1E5
MMGFDATTITGGKMRRWMYLIAGGILTVLGAIGAFLPVMPTTVFLIGALYCFTRSSPTLETWLLTHPKYGPTLTAWRHHGAISKRVKCLACSSMLLSFIILCLFASLPLPAYFGTALFMAIGGYFVVTRPSAEVPSSKSW